MIVSCPDCNGKLSTAAPSCPHCGYEQKVEPTAAEPVGPLGSVQPPSMDLVRGAAKRELAEWTFLSLQPMRIFIFLFVFIASLLAIVLLLRRF